MKQKTGTEFLVNGAAGAPTVRSPGRAQKARELGWLRGVLPSDHDMALCAFASVTRSILHRFGDTPTQQLRRFSASVPRSHTYLVWAPDYADDGALARRMTVRPRHFITANKLIKQGILKVAGGLITPESQDAAPADKKFVGSVLLYEADSIEEVRKLVEQDLYWTENVWHKEKLLILPILMATTLQDKAAITQPTAED
ncbi:hypothetical protein V8E55_004506 [Tylopilus felleus]